MTLPPRLRRGGRASRLSNIQLVEAWAWFKARRAAHTRKGYGTYRTKAAEMGVAEGALKLACLNLLAREKRIAERVWSAQGMSPIDVSEVPF